MQSFPLPVTMPPHKVLQQHEVSFFERILAERQQSEGIIPAAKVYPKLHARLVGKPGTGNVAPPTPLPNPAPYPLG